MKLPTRCALLVLVLATLLFLGAVGNRHLDPAFPGVEASEQRMGLLWALVLAAGTFALVWSLETLVRSLGAGRSREPRETPPFWHRGLAAGLILVIAALVVTQIPAERQRRQARADNTDQAELRRIFDDAMARERIEVLATVASRHDTPPDLLLTLATSDHERLDRPRRHPAALLAGPSGTVWQLVAGHPASPAEGLVRLAEVGSPAVLDVLTRRPETPAGSLAELARHPDERIRAGVVRHPSLRSADLRRLADDPSPTIRQQAQEFLDLRSVDATDPATSPNEHHGPNR